VSGPAEEVLPGGVANEGTVVRIGDTVRRPAGPSSVATRALLLHFEAVGFDRAPRFLGVDEQGREVLSYIDGEVALPPFPAWSLTDAVLVEVGRLLREAHDATGGFDSGAVGGWSDELADPEGGAVLCHADVCPENVVFRGGVAVGLLDWDFAAPGRRLFDVARTAKMYAPLIEPSMRRAHPASLDAVPRFGVLARAYGVEPEEAAALVSAVDESRAVSRAFVARRVAAGEQAFVKMWRTYGGEERDRLDTEWLGAHRSDLERAVAG
jgi:hypothetical protein